MSPHLKLSHGIDIDRSINLLIVLLPHWSEKLHLQEQTASFLLFLQRLEQRLPRLLTGQQDIRQIREHFK